MSSSVEIVVSDEAVKWVIGGACFLGACYLIYKIIETPENDIPLPKKAKLYSELPEVSPSCFESICLHDDIRNRAAPAFKAGDYVGAVRESIVGFLDILREKSGVTADATSLIQRVFGGRQPVLTFVDTSPEHVTNVESGYFSMMEGFSKTIRKIHMHATIELTEKQALQEINLACFFATLVETKTMRVVEL